MKAGPEVQRTGDSQVRANLVYERDGIKKYHVSINSADRDIAKYADPNSYIIPLADPLYGVYSIKLLQAIVPNSEYVVNAQNQWIDFQDTASATRSAMLAPGDYSDVTLGGEIKTAIEAVATGGATYKVIVKSSNASYQITATGGGTPGNFRLLFGPNNIHSSNNAHYLMGFPRSNTVTNATQTSTNRYVVAGDMNYLLGLGNGDGENFGYITREGNTTGQTHFFANIAMNSAPGTYVYFNEESNYDNEYCFPGPERQLTRLEINWKRSHRGDAVPVNFRGVEHSLKFEIVAHLDKNWSRARAGYCT